MLIALYFTQESLPFVAWIKQTIYLCEINVDLGVKLHRRGL